MKYRTTPYILEKDGVYYSFQSEKDACDFLGVPPSCVSSAYRHGIIYHGFNIIKPLSENDIYNNKRLRKIWESMHERCEYENIEDLKALYQLLKDNGVEFFKDYIETDYGKVEFGIYDPDKNMLLISSTL